MSKPRRGIVVAVSIVAALAAVSIAAFLVPTGPRMNPPEGFIPFRDDALASRYCPVFIEGAGDEAPLAIHYRAARDAEGLIHIAYHPLWAREYNPNSGLGPFLSRTFYTSGLSLQRLMYGRGDIESIGLTVDPSGRVVKAEYETAKGYDPHAFSVKHSVVAEEGELTPPLVFAVMSWNHLFSRDPANSGPRAICPPGMTSYAIDVGALPGSKKVPLSYFSQALWRRYAIWKNPETFIRKDRAHFAWERGAAE
jgi:hypothetical protein